MERKTAAVERKTSNEILVIVYNRGFRVDSDGTLRDHNKVKKSTHIKPGRGPSNSYHRFEVVVDGEYRNVMVHRLAAYQKFKDKLFERGIEVRHLDDNSLNNCLDNIGIGTKRDNSYDTDWSTRKRYAKKPKMSRIDSEIALALFNEGWTYDELAERFNVAKSSIAHLVKRGSFYYYDQEEL